MSSKLPHKRHDFRGWGGDIENKMSLNFLNNFCLKHLILMAEFGEIHSQMYEGTHVTYLLFLSILMKREIFSTDFRKVLNIIFNENPSTGSRTVPCGRAEGRTDRMKLIVVFRTCGNAPKNYFATSKGETRKLLTVEVVEAITKNTVTCDAAPCSLV
jgi:hypothetical protein